MSVGFKDRCILLSKNAVITRLDVVDSSSLNHRSYHFNVVVNFCCIPTFLVCTVELIVKNSAVEPVGVINLDHSLVRVNVFGGFQVT